MWFDVGKAVAEIAGGNLPPATHPPATTATIATKGLGASRFVAVVAIVLGPSSQKLVITPGTVLPSASTPSAPDAVTHIDMADLSREFLSFGPDSLSISMNGGGCQIGNAKDRPASMERRHSTMGSGSSRWNGSAK